MINIIKTCSCFLDKAVWFVNLSGKESCRPWLFDHVRIQLPFQDIIENKFIKEVRTKRTAGVLQNTIVVSCVDCLNYQVYLSFEEKSVFDTIDCRFVVRSLSTFDDYYCSDIFVGNSQLLKIISFHMNREK